MLTYMYSSPIFLSSCYVVAVPKMPINIFQITTVLDKKLSALHCILRTHSPSKNVQNEKDKKFCYCKEKLLSC